MFVFPPYPTSLFPFVNHPLDGNLVFIAANLAYPPPSPDDLLPFTFLLAKLYTTIICWPASALLAAIKGRSRYLGVARPISGKKSL